MSEKRPLRHRRQGLVGLAVLILTGMLSGAIVGSLSLSVHSYLTGYRYRSFRYYDVGGAIELAIDGFIALVAGGLLGGRLGWLLGVWRASLIWKERLPGGRLTLVDLIVLGPVALVLAYLVYIANFG